MPTRVSMCAADVSIDLMQVRPVATEGEARTGNVVRSIRARSQRNHQLQQERESIGGPDWHADALQ